MKVFFTSQQPLPTTLSLFALEKRILHEKQHKRHCNQHSQPSCSSHMLSAFQSEGLLATNVLKFCEIQFHRTHSLRPTLAEALFQEAQQLPSLQPARAADVQLLRRAALTALSTHTIPSSKYDKYNFFSILEHSRTQLRTRPNSQTTQQALSLQF